MKLILKPLFLVSTLTVIALATGGFFGFKYWQTRKLLDRLKQSPPASADAATQKTIAEVGTIFALPDEQPTVATITDRDKLKNQPFFSQAENGDTVLIFVQAKKALLYRSSIHKIIDIAPLNISSPSATATPSAYPSQPSLKP